MGIISYIRKIQRHVTLQLRKSGMDVAIDSTSFSLITSSKWFDIRIKRVSKRKDHIKLHIIIDVNTGIIHHFTITDWKRNDTYEFRTLINYLPRLGKVIGDKGYSSRKNCQAVAEKKGIPYLCFKTNVTGKAKGYSAWKISINAFMDNPKKWMEEYYNRSIVESVFASIKRCWGSNIRSKKGWLKKKELAIKVLAYNIKRTLYIERAEKVGISLWTNCK